MQKEADMQESAGETRERVLNPVGRVMGIFLLVVLSTFPLVIPFLFIGKTSLAIRVSNLVTLALLLSSGWILARYSSGNAWTGGVAIAIVGTLLLLAISG